MNGVILGESGGGRALAGQFQRREAVILIGASHGRDRLLPKLADSCRWATKRSRPRTAVEIDCELAVPAKSGLFVTIQEADIGPIEQCWRARIVS